MKTQTNNKDLSPTRSPWYAHLMSDIRPTISRTPDPDFPCEIFLSCIPVPACGNDEKCTAARQLHMNL